MSEKLLSQALSNPETKPMTRFFVLILFMLFANNATAQAAETISFPSSSTYFGKDVALTGQLAFADSDERQPLVILLHGCGGLIGAVRTSLHSHANALNRHGFATLVMDSFKPRGHEDDWVCQKLSRIAAAQGYRQRDVIDAIEHLGSHPKIDISKTLVMGQSNGGSVASLLSYGSDAERIIAAVAFYPWCGAVPFEPRVPLMVLAGEKDEWTPPADCIERAKGCELITVKTYPGATHSFDLPIPRITYMGHVLEGDETATKDSQRRMIEFFKHAIGNAD